MDGKKLALDSNAIIAYREGIEAVCDLLDKTAELFLPVIVFGELLYGAINSNRPKENEEAVRKFIAHTTVVSIDEDIAVRYSSIRLGLKKKGFPIPENDIWIAAACIELNIPLLSKDKHFKNIHGLKVINWDKNF